MAKPERQDVRPERSERQPRAPAHEQPRSEAPRRTSEQPRLGEGERAARSERTPSPKRETRHDAWTDTPPPQRRDAPRGERAPEARDKPRPAQPRAPSPQQQSGDRVGFQENMPAFMRKPSRPLKQPGRG
jgi:hypothetical protein